MRIVCLAVIGCAAAAISGAQQKIFIGAESCGFCHASEFSRQSKSAHARSLYRAAQHPLASAFTTTAPLLRGSTFRFQFLRAGSELRVKADDGRYVIELPLEWAFGAGRQAVTFVSRVSPEFHLESSFSYYADSGSFDITPRHELLPSRTLHEAMGQAIRTQSKGESIVSCFGCHSTGAATVSPAGEVQIGESGVRCESCHGGGSAHLAAALQGNASETKKLIVNPGAFPASELNRFCGRCHRTGAESPPLDWDSPWSVRHQPPFLMRSRCFQNRPRGLSCVACHNPHEDLRRNDAAYYRAACVKCHHDGNRPPASVCLKPANPDCAGCHMPAVAPGGHLKFRNHWIGVYSGGNVQRPLR